MIFRNKADFSCNALYTVLERSAKKYGIRRRSSGGQVINAYNSCLAVKMNQNICLLMINFK